MTDTARTPKAPVADAQRSANPFPGTEYYIPGDLDLSGSDAETQEIPADWQEFPGAEYFSN